MRAGAELREFRPVPGDDLLVIDVAVLRGAGQGLLLHVSGTHGVEGFIGSAIQRAALADREALLHGHVHHRWRSDRRARARAQPVWDGTLAAGG